MKYAKAMKYGGELIDAAGCDYSDFKDLVPMCPECNEVVHLRKGGDRVSVKGKPYKIGNHWAHSKGRDAEHVAGCEARVSGYTEKDKLRIASEAKGQRLGLIKKWFYEISREYWVPCEYLSPWCDETKKEEIFKYAESWDSMVIDGAIASLEGNPKSIMVTASKMIDEFGLKLSTGEIFKEGWLDHNAAFVEEYFTKHPFHHHKKIVLEVLGWLSGSVSWSCTYDFLKTFQAAYEYFYLETETRIFIDRDDLDRHCILGPDASRSSEGLPTEQAKIKFLRSQAEQILDDAVLALIRIPWIEVFAKKENI